MKNPAMVLFVKSRNAFTFICIGQCISLPIAIYSPLEVSGRLCPSIHSLAEKEYMTASQFRVFCFISRSWDENEG